MRHTYQSEQWLPHPVDLVFAFFANPENLPPLMPHWQRARIDQAAIAPPPPRPETGPLPGRQAIAAGAGTRMTLSFRPFPFSPIRAHWDAKITEFVWNDHFCDHQLRGPFVYWHHCHTVRPETRADQTGTLLHDHVEYEAPLGKLGDLANHLVLSRQLRSSFDYRHTRTRELLANFAQPA